MAKVRLRKIRELIASGSDLAMNEIGGTLINQAIKIAKDPFEFSDLGYINHDIVDTGKLSKSFRVRKTPKYKGSRNKITLGNVARSDEGFNYPKIIRLGRGSMRGRPFYDRAIKYTRSKAIYAKHLRALGFNLRVNKFDEL